MDQPKNRGKHRVQAENEIIRRREKESRYNELWGGTVKYFDHWSKANTKFDEWTSPRYYDENNKLVTGLKAKRDKEELLVKRREKLRKLYEEEKRAYEIELMLKKNKHLIEKPSPRTPNVPTEVLKNINDQIKLEEETKRRKEAEEKLFNQWRRNNPVVRQYESKYNCKDLKLSWLDQQIEKRMQKEREEKQAKRLLKENECRLKIEKENEERQRKQLEINKQQLKDALERQMYEIREKQRANDELREKEDKEIAQKMLLLELEEKVKVEEQRRKDKEIAVFNIRQHNRKLKQKSKDIQENLQEEKLLMTRLKEIQLEEIIEEETRRREIREGIEEFLDIVRQQQVLEIQRQKRLEFLFDSEAKSMYDMQTELWRQEELARQNLINEVLSTVKQQIISKIEANKELQRENLVEREKMTHRMEEYNEELNNLKREEENKKRELKKVREEDVAVKVARKQQQESFKMKELNEELDRIKKEEERLKEEILRIQQRREPFRPARRRFLL